MHIFYYKGLKVLVHGEITKDARRNFGKRIKIMPDGNGITIDNINKKDSGNYTCMYRWLDVYHHNSHKYSYHVTVNVAPEPRPTTPRHITTAASNITIATPTHGKAKGLATRMATSVWCLALMALTKIV